MSKKVYKNLLWFTLLQYLLKNMEKHQDYKEIQQLQLCLS